MPGLGNLKKFFIIETSFLGIDLEKKNPTVDLCNIAKMEFRIADKSTEVWTD